MPYLGVGLLPWLLSFQHFNMLIMCGYLCMWYVQSDCVVMNRPLAVVIPSAMQRIRKSYVVFVLCVRLCVRPCVSTQEQNEQLWSVRDMLRRVLSNNQLKEMLQFNGQSVPSGESNVSSL